MFYSKIYDMVQECVDKRSPMYEDGISLDEKLEETLANSDDVREYDCGVTCAFDSPGGNVYAVYVAYVDNEGRLQTINEIIDEG